MSEIKHYYEEAQDPEVVKNELATFVVRGLMNDRTKAVLTFHGLIWWPGPDIVPGLTDKGFGMAYRRGLFQQVADSGDTDNAYYEILGEGSKV